MLYSQDFLQQAHSHSFKNKKEILESSKVGCFFCLRIYSASEISEVDYLIHEGTPMCPHCQIDSVIGDASGLPITNEFLKQMHEKWFQHSPVSETTKVNTVFTDLERAVLDWYLKHYQDKSLTEQIRSARFIKREWTKVGYYTSFEVNKSLPKLTHEFPLDGPGIISPQIDIEALTLLWGEEGYISCIEMVSYGEAFGEIVSEFKLSPI